MYVVDVDVCVNYSPKLKHMGHVYAHFDLNIFMKHIGQMHLQAT